MENFYEILKYELWGNTFYDYGRAFIVFVALFIVFKLFQFIILKRLAKFAERTENKFDDKLVKIVKNISPLFYFVISIYIPLRMIVMDELAMKIITGIFLVVVVYQVITTLQSFIEYFLIKVAVKKDGDDMRAKATFVGIRLLIRIVLWSTAILLILSNLGVNITSLIASLGIGGLAIAFAVQNVLVDLFSSVSIYFDKPFEIGDTIKIGDQTGQVNYIGLKTTRIQTLEGDELVVSNSELTSSQVRNFGKMEHRRVKTNLGFEYGTPLKKLKSVNETIEKIIGKVEDAEFVRSHFKEFGDSSLNFEFIYMVMSGDMNEYMDRQQEINFALAEVFEKEGIEMAFPTQTVHLKKD